MFDNLKHYNTGPQTEQHLNSLENVIFIKYKCYNPHP